MADRTTPIHSGYSIINASFSGTATAKLGCWMEYKVVSQSVENNTSTIRFYVYIANVAATGGYHIYCNNYDQTNRGSMTVKANGSTVYMRQNEKYKGDAILQKSFTVDFLFKKMKKNEGEVPQYVVTDSHPAIIDRREWEYVQAEMAKRKAKGRHQNSLSPFSAKIYCGERGGLYGSKVWHSTDKYRRVVWRCNGKYERQTGCSTPHLSEKEIESLFMSAISKLHDQRTALIADCEAVIVMLSDNTEIETERKRIETEQKTVEALVDALIRENAARPMDQNDYNARYDGYQREHDTLRGKLEKLNGKKEKRQRQIKVLDRFISDLREMRDMPVKFRGSLCNAFVEKLTIYPDGKAEFLFKNGAVITEEL